MKLMTCDIIAGCYGGACGVVVGYPLDTIKTLQQKSNAKLLPTIASIYQRNRGLKCFAGFYRGMFFPCITNGGLNSVIFAVYGAQIRFMQKPFREDEKKVLWERHVFVAGSCAGLLQSFLACPIEVIKIRLQTLTYIGGPIKCAKDVIKKHGLLGMYRGITPMCFRDVFPYGIYMLVYDKMLNIESDVLDNQRKFVGGSGYGKINSHLEMTLTALAGATAGVLSWLFVVPFDVAKTVMQADFRYKSMYHCMHEIAKKNGWRALFRGSFIVIARAIPVNAATFLGYEYCLDKCYSSFPIDDPVPKNNFHFFS